MLNLRTQQELQLHYWGPHYDMVKEYNAKHGTNIQPWECVRSNAPGGYSDHPGFIFAPGCYSFALTILYDDKRKEHRPVFVGDKVYDKNIPKELEVIDSDTLQYGVLKFTDLDWDKISWNPPTPKRTFKIGDMDLPCPERENEGYQLSMWNRNYYFKSAEDRELVKFELLKILTAARDKE